jgi:hypothetical protein
MRIGGAPPSPFSQEVVMPCRQFRQVPSLIANGAITKSPGFTVRTSAPTSSTMPTNSWPLRYR